MASEELVVVVVAFADAAAAEAVGRELVEARLAACAQVWPIRSIYRWQDAVEQAEEVRLEAKTLAVALPAVEAMIRERHSYDVPEIIATPMIFAGDDYTRWVRENVADPGSTAAGG